ncbi:amidohydrolase [Flavisolibacter ginsengisoli]|uniref:Omega-amidase YafV n=1 Tax=Flavisolibacter ginsengisoli DSM 18119 TaxID=1121884 RepID=A0A1M4XV99_9BACT|nr:amidohydrolase [Flavisolibacter ginsengisoli]SHE97276.1 Carbon-nitrogen hydrolase [Flavisolibacter ginsengisoli DSM 18119]
MSNLKVSLVQTSLHWEDKASNLSMLSEKIAGVKASTHLVVLPEMFTTGFSMKPEQLAENMEGDTLAWMQQTARDNKVILTGSMIAEQEGNYYNRLVWMLPNGQYGTYDKRHLFAFAEEDKHYTSGTKRLIASVNGWKVHLLVCYDLRFPVWARQQFDEQGNYEYDVLVYVANWPEKRSTAWKSLLQARAIENQCYVVGVNRVGKDANDIIYSGDSMVIDPLGEILYQKANEEDVATLTLDKDHLDAVRKRFPFWRDADNFDILL